MKPKIYLADGRYYCDGDGFQAYGMSPFLAWIAWRWMRDTAQQLNERSLA